MRDKTLIDALRTLQGGLNEEASIRHEAISKIETAMANNHFRVQALIEVLTSRPPRFTIWKWSFGKKELAMDELQTKYGELVAAFEKRQKVVEEAKQQALAEKNKKVVEPSVLTPEPAVP